MKTFVEGLENLARRFPNKPAIVYGKNRDVITWKQLDERTNALANAFLDLGAKRDERIAFSLYNDHETIECTYACWKIAAAPVNVHYKYFENEIYYVMDREDATLAVFEEDLIDRMIKIRPDLKKVRNYIVVGKKTPKGMYNYEELIKKYPKTRPKLDWAPLKETDVGYNLMTGGTTGYPKGAVYSQRDMFGTVQRALLTQIVPLIGRWGKAPKNLFDAMNRISPLPLGTLLYSLRPLITNPTIAELVGAIAKAVPYNLFVRILDFLPYFTAGRLHGLILAPMIHGAAWVNAVEYQMVGAGVHFLPTEERFIGEEMAETIEREKINIILMVGDAVAKPMLDALEKGQYDTSSVWAILQMGAIMTAPIKRRLTKAIPSVLLVDLFSGTEMWAAAAQVYTASDTEEEIEKMTFKLTPDIRVVNELESGTLVDVKPGEVGEVITHSDLRFDANYYGEPDKSKKTFRMIDGKQWIFTGDLGSITDDGKSFYLLGRGSLCINTGGEKVYVEEVEELIETNPKVKKAAIAGVPDERWGEAVTAVIQLKEGEKATEDEIRDFCRDKIAGYKIPKHVIFVDEVPVGVTGKCEYKKAKEIALKKL